MSERALAAAICPKRYGSSTIEVKKSTDCRIRPPPNGTYPASSRVSIPLTKPSAAAGASPFSTCSRSPGANLEAQPAFCEYFVSLMRVFSFTRRLYPSPPFGTGPPPPDSDDASLPSVTAFQLLYTLLLPRTQYVGPTPGLLVERRRRLEPPLLRPNGDSASARACDPRELVRGPRLLPVGGAQIPYRGRAETLRLRPTPRHANLDGRLLRAVDVAFVGFRTCAHWPRRKLLAACRLVGGTTRLHDAPLLLFGTRVGGAVGGDDLVE